jgi:hypothetical protein
MEALMQKFSYQFSERDRRIVRRWRLASIGFYGSILVGLVLFAAFSRHDQVDYASAKPALSASAETKARN